MAPSRLTDRPVQLRLGDSEDEYVSNESEGESEQSTAEPDDKNDSGSDPDEARVDAASEQEQDSTDEEPEDLKNISFGVLAKAQESFTPPSKSRKRKLEPDQTPASTTPIDNPHPTRETLSKKPKKDLTSRTSKHAPAVLSSRNPVSRKREIISPPPAQKSRDPRFDPTITSRTLNVHAVARADKAYSFLTDYQASEILALKAEIKKTVPRDTDRAAELKKELMSMEARLRNVQTRTKEREILQRHRAQEKKAIKDGKKERPYFLKQSDVRKEVERERVEGLNKKQKDKMEKRKRMREKTKEAKDMPWARRMG